MKSGKQLHNLNNKTTFQLTRVLIGPFLHLIYQWEKEQLFLQQKCDS